MMPSTKLLSEWSTGFCEHCKRAMPLVFRGPFRVLCNHKAMYPIHTDNGTIWDCPGSHTTPLQGYGA